jgi:hypothetical protein
MPTPSLSSEQLQQAVDAVAEAGTVTGASRLLDLNRATLEGRLREAKRRGFTSTKTPPLVMKGQSVLRNAAGEEVARWDKSKLAGRDDAEVAHVPDPKRITKVSTYYDQLGNVAAQWVSERPEDIAREKAWEMFAAGLAEKLPRVRATKGPTKANADLLAVYPVGDHHVGMLAWEDETGDANYDLRIAGELLAAASERLIETCPPCDQAVLAFLGDFLHYDSFAAVTPTHGHLLDADGRFPKMVDAGIRMIRSMVSAALDRHKKVHIIFSTGNHDIATSAFMRIMLAALYEAEPRVTVDKAPSRFHYYEWGRCLLGVHHGDRVKMDKLPAVMAHDRHEAWGRTSHRIWLTGHVHHDSRKEYPGCHVESFGVLAPLDAYASAGGYRSQRSMKALVFHRQHGEQERHTVNPGMLEVAA